GSHDHPAKQADREIAGHDEEVGGRDTDRGDEDAHSEGHDGTSDCHWADPSAECHERELTDPDEDDARKSYLARRGDRSEHHQARAEESRRSGNRDELPQELALVHNGHHPAQVDRWPRTPTTALGSQWGGAEGPEPQDVGLSQCVPMSLDSTLHEDPVRSERLGDLALRVGRDVTKPTATVQSVSGRHEVGAVEPD